MDGLALARSTRLTRIPIALTAPEGDSSGFRTGARRRSAWSRETTAISRSSHERAREARDSRSATSFPCRLRARVICGIVSLDTSERGSTLGATGKATHLLWPARVPSAPRGVTSLMASWVPTRLTSAVSGRLGGAFRSLPPADLLAHLYECRYASVSAPTTRRLLHLNSVHGALPPHEETYALGAAVLSRRLA